MQAKKRYLDGFFSRVLACTFLCAAVMAPPSSLAQLAPEQAVAQMKTAEGLEVTLFAAEPDLVNPTCIDVDSRGRVWVAEAVNYRLFNQEIAAELGDRIRVLEDTTGDGRCDKATTFYQDPSLQAPMGIAVLGDRVYVCQSPDLFYLEDTDHDGVADKKTVILTGFGGVDNDHGLHGIVFGPDGYLYMSNGDQGLDVTDSFGNRIHAGRGAPVMAATVMRTDLDGKRLELLSQGMRNPYEPAVDSFGMVTISDNDDDGNENTRINYVMEGGHYGYWPRRKGDRHLDTVHWNEDRPGVVPKMLKTGFGSPTGLLVYEGDALPRRLFGTLIHADAGPGEIRSYRVASDGAGYSAEQEVLLSNKGDSWFRPSDVTAAPDGSIFVADWYDPGVGGHRLADVNRGRIYRLARKGSRWSVPELDLESDEGLAAAFGSPNIARRFLAYQILEDRMEAGDTRILEALFRGEFPVLASRALWLLAKNDRAGRDAVLEAARSSLPEQRIQAVRILYALDLNPADTAPWLLEDPDPSVRRQILVEIARNGATLEPWAIDIAAMYDGTDRFYREAVGIAFKGRESWAFDQLKTKLGPVWDERLAGLAIQLHPPEVVSLAREALAGRSTPVHLKKLALQALDATGTKEAGREIVGQLHNNAPKELQIHALNLLSRDGGAVWRGVFKDTAIDDYLSTALSNSQLRTAARQFIRETHRTAFLPDFVAQATNTRTDLAERLDALNAARSLASRIEATESASAIEILVPLLTDPEPQIQRRALRAIQAFPGDASMERLKVVLVDRALSKSLRLETARLMASRRSGAVALLTVAEQDELPYDITLGVTELVHRSQYEDVRLMAQKILPRDATRDGISLPPLETLIHMAGDPARGKDVFFSSEASECSRCHVVQGQGAAVGPDLSTIGEKLGRQGLLESILSPSAAIAPEYKVWMIRTRLEGYLSGYIRAENDTSLTLVESAGNERIVSKQEILERFESEASLMPTGLSAGMTAQELVDVVEYLSTLNE